MHAPHAHTIVSLITCSAALLRWQHAPLPKVAKQCRALLYIIYLLLFFIYFNRHLIGLEPIYTCFEDKRFTNSAKDVMYLFLI